MKYRDLVQFEPIDTVVQLKTADKQQKALELVQSYVISERISQQLTDLIFPQLQYDEPVDNKGILIVGNYGTGKSHLMSVISAIAEYPDVLPAVRSDEVAEAAKQIAGKFKVIRAELGGSAMTLRDIILGAIQNQLHRWGIDYTFLPVDQVPNNKDPMVEMMNSFHEVFPDHGLLLVVDELLDYLRGRKEQELILDLNFLREIGEVCALTRFRFVAGLQEALFDSPRFQFAAHTLGKVKDRFHQVRIVKQDVAYVVSRRLLQKTDAQRAKIEQYLQKFTHLYNHMTERMEEFIDLFPIHPSYLDAFEQMSIAENREILKTISDAIKKLIDTELPQDELGLLAYDHYWSVMQENPVLRSITEVRDVLDKSKVLADRIEKAFTIPFFKPAALRIIRALSVHRLTTDDIYTPLGLTAEELRDQLCLHLPEQPDSDFLKTSIESILREISRTVSGQFISTNEENQQYYLDLKKDIDYDALIEQKAETLSDSQLDRYYFDVLLTAMECSPTPYVRGHRIWQYSIEWRERKVMRLGYLFFGAPNERSTAHPPRDFYIYFLQPFDPPSFVDEKKADEVFLKLINRDEEFDNSLRLFAASRELASTSSRGTRRIYDEKGDGYKRTLIEWLHENFNNVYDVTYKGVTRKAGEFLRSSSDEAFRDQVNIIASTCLAPHFQDLAPEYPAFPNLITQENIPQAVGDAIKWILGQIKPKQGRNVLTALELLGGERLDPSRSRYAKHILSLLRKKGPGKVLNRNEIVKKHYDEVEYEIKYRLEPELVVVVLASLIYTGDITMTVGRLKIDAGNIEELGRMPLESLVNFSSIEPPRDLPIPELKELFEFLGLPPGLIVDPTNRDDAVRQMQEKLGSLIEREVKARHNVQEGLSFWGMALLDETEKASLLKALEELDAFLQPLSYFNTPAKLRNFKYTLAEIKAQSKNVLELERLEKLLDLISSTMSLTGYLTTAESVLGKDDPWTASVQKKRLELFEKIKTAQDPTILQTEIKGILEKLKEAYIESYYDAHQKARLNSYGEKRKKGLRSDFRLRTLNSLRQLDWLSPNELDELQNRLDQLKVCDSLTKSKLKDVPYCPHCGFKPQEEDVKVNVNVALEQLELDLDKLYQKWTANLIDSLQDPSTQQDFELLDPKVQQRLKEIVSQGALPENIDTTLLSSIKSVLSGLIPVYLSFEALKKSLSGAPCTKEEFRKRFERYLDTLTQGQDQTKIRIVIK